MKKIILFAAILLTGLYTQAQDQLAFPFQGGKEVMARFFKDSITVPSQLIAKKAHGTVIFKFTADEKGTIKKIIIYYADDISLTQPAIEALKKSNNKWIIPDGEKFHDFIIPFSIGFTPPAVASTAFQKAAYNFYKNSKPVVSYDQVPLDMATLLPTVTVKYDLPK